MTQPPPGRTVHSHKPRHEHAPMTGYYRVPKLTSTDLDAILSRDTAPAPVPTSAPPAPTAAALEARSHMARALALLQAQTNRTT